MPLSFPKKLIHISLKSLLNMCAIAMMVIGVVFWYFLLILNAAVSKISEIKANEVSGSLMGLQFFFYFFAFLPISYMIRRGVKKESVPTLQWSSTGFIVIQLYGVLIQLLNGYPISSFATEDPHTKNLKDHPLLLEIFTQSTITILFIILIYVYIEKLKSHFYIPPVYPCRVEYFYYPEDSLSSITVFHKQVPCTIMHNYQNSAYFVQQELSESQPSSSSHRSCFNTTKANSLLQKNRAHPRSQQSSLSASRCPSASPKINGLLKGEALTGSRHGCPKVDGLLNVNVNVSQPSNRNQSANSQRGHNSTGDRSTTMIINPRTCNYSTT